MELKFLHQVKKFTSKAEGVDLSKTFSQYALKNYNVKVNNANYDKYKYDKKFDIILMFNVIENLSDPKKLLKLF